MLSVATSLACLAAVVVVWLMNNSTESSKPKQINASSVEFQLFDTTNVTMASPSAHLFLIPPKSDDTGERLKFNGFVVVNISRANATNSLVTHQTNVDVISGQVTILTSGLYVIYCSIYFKPDSAKPCRSFKQQVWEARMVLSRHGKTKPVLRLFHTCCNNCMREKNSQFEAGVFQLTTGDRVFVEVSGEGVTEFDEHSSFFGLVMVGL
ncbi:tumor necrosis factor ligand superfamily member 10-like [Physella acuta]|uniref:tumor necrosis factor ligand superfamily member 10-like n=1 Tax=Physella acuta TaxID=109671 RepID=UPI0027DB1B1B|nr:tumor necrosis factor ligand superfamily member 10-like [Physella acuta]